MPLTVDTVWRDYATGGVPSSGAHQPVKNEIRDLLRPMEAAVSSFLSNGGLVYATYALLQGNFNAQPNQMAWVILDPVVANNGIYQKQPVGWLRVADLPYDFILASDGGSGTPNAIVASSLLPIGVNVLVAVTLFETTTAAPVTISFNGGSPLTIKTATGNDPAPGGLTAGMALLGLHQGSVFRLLSDQASMAIQAAAEAAQVAAEDARDLAIQAADQAAVVGAGDVPTYPSRALVAASTVPVERKYIWTAGYALPGDGGFSLYVRVAADPGHPYKVRSTDRFMPDGSTNSTNGGWWEGRQAVVNPKMFGAPNDGVAHDDAALRDLALTLQAGKAKHVAFSGAYRIYQNEAAVLAGSVVELTAVHGLTFEFHNTVFTCTFDQAALAAGVNWANNIFYFHSCQNFRGIGRPKFVGNWTKSSIKVFGSAFGIIGLNFTDDCTGVTLDGADGQGILCPLYLVSDAVSLRFRSESPIVSAKGSGYTVGNTLTVSGVSNAVMTVGAVDGGGGVTRLDWSSYGVFNVMPTVSGLAIGYEPGGGSGSGLRFIAYLERHAQNLHTKGGSIGYVSAYECYYGLVQRNSGDNVTAVVYAEYCYRASFVYGAIIGAKTYTTIRHPFRSQVLVGQGPLGIGNEGHYLFIKLLPSTEAGYSSADCLCRPSMLHRNPCKMDVHIDVDLEYGNALGRAANFLEITKYADSALDNGIRGHDFRLKLTGRIKGTSDLGGSEVPGAHVSMNTNEWLGEYFHDWQIGPLDIEGGGYILIDPAAFGPIPSPAGVPSVPLTRNGGIHFDVAARDSYVLFSKSGGLTDFLDGNKSRVPISVSPRSRFLNRTGGGPAGANYPACIGCIETNQASLNVLPGWHEWILRSGGGSGAVQNWFLPPTPYKGLRFHIHNTSYFAGSILNIYPQLADAFFGHAPAKFLALAQGASATIECAQVPLDVGETLWYVTSSSGAISYQP